MTATLATLRRNGSLRRADAALAEWVSRAFPDDPCAVALAAALAARAVAGGHSALQLDQAQAWLDGLGDGREPVALPSAAAWCELLRGAAAVHTGTAGDDADGHPLVLDAQGRVYLGRYFEYERRLAHGLIARVAGHAGRSAATEPLPHMDGVDAAQRQAVATALARRFTLVTGGPGTGKTHSVVRILAELARQADERGAALRIALAAPTGKAAARLAESVQSQRARLALPETVLARIPGQATTLHRLIGWSPWQPRPRHDADTPLPFDVVVVDEVSMVDLPLMAKLVDAVHPDARLVLLGDPGQLAAVEAGNVLGALVEAAHDGPLRDCHVALVHSHRFARDSALATLAAAIAEGDADAALGILDGNAGVSRAAATDGLLDAATGHYRAVVDAADPVAALQAARGFRLLTALRQGPSGCVAIDRAIAARLQRAIGVRADRQWWRGRLVMVTGNRPELGLFNGDVGVAWPDAEGTMRVWFDAADGTARALSPAALPPHEGAFALTVHKAQGSEFEQVALLTGPDSAVLTRELLYTGVTRARSGITVYSAPEVLRAGIERRTLRFTGLADRLREAAALGGRRAVR